MASPSGTRKYTHNTTTGQRTFAGPTASPNETAYTWTGERLKKVTYPGGVSEFTYDASGQRTKSVVTAGGITTTTTWLYDGLRLLGLSATRSDTATYTLDYLYDEKGVLFAGVYAGTGTSAVPFVIVTTDRGDVRELVDQSGRAFAHYRYDPYGRPAAPIIAGTSRVPTATATAIASRQVLRYASYCYDEPLSLYYCSQRYYDPAVAAFISRDPARADGEESAYQYCGGDPVGKVDPSGLFRRRVIWSSRTAGDACMSGMISVMYAVGEQSPSPVLGVTGEAVYYRLGLRWTVTGTRTTLRLSATFNHVAHDMYVSGWYTGLGGRRTSVRMPESRASRRARTGRISVQRTVKGGVEQVGVSIIIWPDAATNGVYVPTHSRPRAELIAHVPWPRALTCHPSGKSRAR